MDACGGKGGKVAVGVMVGSLFAITVFFGVGVCVAACGVTGSAVGTGPTGLMTFLA